MKAKQVMDDPDNRLVLVIGKPKGSGQVRGMCCT